MPSRRVAPALAALLTAATLAACGASSSGHPDAAAGSAATTRSASPDPAATVSITPSEQGRPKHRAASTKASAPLPGTPPIANPTNIYADAGPNDLLPRLRHVPYRIYVPNSGGSSVTVIDPRTYRVIGQFTTGLNPQHVVPSYDMRSLYVTNDQANSLTRINPMTGRPQGPNIPVNDPYNMYFTPNGRYAIVVAEAEQELDFRDPHTFALRHRVRVDCPGIDHMDFSANGGFLIATCEFSAKLVKVNLHTLKVVKYRTLPGGSPQDIKLDPTGRVFYVADRYRGGVWRIDGNLKPLGFIPTGRDAHGLYPSRNGKDLYVTNRGAGSVSVIDFRTHRVVHVWQIPGGGSPDMGNTSPDGKVLWLAGRYNSTVYALSTTDGHLLARIPVGLQPHGLCVWPQPGRYSLGHTGVTR